MTTSRLRRIVGRPRLAVRYWPGWVDTTRRGRWIGPRPILALHRTPVPNCPQCDGTGEVESGSPYQEEPDIDPCPCAPFHPLLKLWLPHAAARLATAIDYRRNRHLYSSEPPF
ncbi:hypothetical protein [Actinacidiphila acididurans]|uniref:Uncharacterized protein n=1 Tax=Actinacidiphila acididurans TaxID=2784346 RepID=A0ABS2TTM9_9ACTN|nr:hypothetical protein [Actinacidiphila acididurans]MBM9505313.1 hypothetical protein [Actinacidiphila acididurans]